MGLQRTEADHPSGTVASQGSRRRLRGAQRGISRSGHGLGRLFRVERRRFARRSQQDHFGVLRECSGTVCCPRRVVFTNRLLFSLSYLHIVFCLKGLVSVFSFFEAVFVIGNEESLLTTYA